MIAYVGVNNGIPARWQGAPAAIRDPGASQVATTEQSRADRRQAEAEAQAPR
jgi:hypothetical protein